VDFRLVVVLAVALPLGTAAAALVRQAWHGQARANDARGWPSTPGRVISSGVREVQVRQRVRTSVGRYRIVTRYAPAMVYTYVVNGAQYRGERLRMGEGFVSSDTHAAERASARYPIDSQVIVFYNPADPSDSTLDTRSGWGTRVLWAIAAGLLAAIILVAALIMSGPPIRP
jgi:hypothetical protein